MLAVFRALQGSKVSGFKAPVCWGRGLRGVAWTIQLRGGHEQIDP